MYHNFPNYNALNSTLINRNNFSFSFPPFVSSLTYNEVIEDTNNFMFKLETDVETTKRLCIPTCVYKVCIFTYIYIDFI